MGGGLALRSRRSGCERAADAAISKLQERSLGDDGCRDEGFAFFEGGGVTEVALAGTGTSAMRRRPAASASVVAGPP